MIANSIEELIGNTPLVKLGKLSKLSGATILAKCEFMNPTSSVKDRIALNMINRALESGRITLDSTIIEPTSGNTGVGLAAICASKGIKLILTMPESMSIERRKLLKHLGAKIVLTPASEGMHGAINRAEDLATKLGGLVLQQFQNPDNPTIHRRTTAIELLKDTNNRVDYFISAVGTGGTMMGTSEVLKEHLPNLKAIAVEPTNSAVLSGEEMGSHKIQGIGAGFIPTVLNTDIIDEIIKMDDERAFEMARKVAKEEGLLVGISSGANVAAAFEVALREENQGKVIVTILCDTAERYMSTELFE
ncbi:cysteine synthase A [Sulfurovum sp. bin170]|uniref:cysteine synthase A n=1 Tax=Sulfurovum sp. bin170 TaxID=2695268 RepID=UPI0013DE8B73|nr:cysteine synthase A [Sulfurovum sp. bin170]NEW60600.1 cysteine synthase A [Sulfurovum sp. bin170]